MNSIKKIFFIVIISVITIFAMNITCMATTEGTITEETVRLRKEASTDSNTIVLIAKDEKVEVLEKSGNWIKVKYKQNTGYVHKDYIKLQEELATNTEDSNEVNTEENTNENSNETEENTTQSEYKTVSEEQSLYIVPLINSSVIYKITPNTKVSIIKEINGWAYVTSDEFSGWIRSNKLVDVKDEQEETTNVEEVEQEQTETQEKQEEQKEEETKKGYIKVDGANLRKQANTSSNILTVLYKNAEVTVINTENGWSKVKAENLEGYISSSLISDTKVETTTTSRSTTVSRTNITNEPTVVEEQEQTESTTEEISNESTDTEVNVDTSLGQQIVDFAMRYKGYPYVYGGAGPNSFDCSGFTQYVYKQFGYSLPHSATSQSYCGTRVSKSELRLGDLVIFTESGSSAIGHVGIYIGNSSFIHASTPTKGVIVSSLIGYYESRYVTGVRIY